MKDIEKIENTKEYKELRKKADIRRKKIAETKKQKEKILQQNYEIEKEKTINMIENFTIEVKRISLEDLKEKTLKAKEEWYDIHLPYKKVYNEFLYPDEDEEEEIEFMGYEHDDTGYYEYIYFDNDVYNAPEEVINRWMINYIRHNLSNYDSNLEKIKDKEGRTEAYKKYKAKLAEEMKRVYPEIKEEIDKYMLHR